MTAPTPRPHGFRPALQTSSWLTAILLAMVALAAHTPQRLAAAENWPQFRGPRGDGQSLSTQLPVEFQEKKNVRWKTAIHGKGWSSPVVWGSRIWLTTATPDGHHLSAIELDAADGRILRDFEVFAIEKPQFCIEKNSYASPTPTIEEGRLYAHFGAHGTACIDTASGKVLWSRQDLPCNHHRGAASSPILVDNLLVLTFDGFDIQYVVALDKATGKTVWKSDRAIEYDSDNGDIKKAYATPQLIEVDGKQQLVAPSAGATIAYEPKTGRELWRIRSGGMNASARPLFGQGQLFITTADGGFRMFAARPDGTGDVTKSHVTWKQVKGVPKYSSPIFHDGLLLLGNEAGVLTCLDAATGDVVWQERVGGVFTASPLAAGKHVYFFSEDGQVVVVEASRTFRTVATNRLDDGFTASPAVAGDALILRTTKNLYRIEAAP